MKHSKHLQLFFGVVLGLAGVVGYVAYRTRRVPTPKRRWWRFSRPGARPLPPGACKTLQGLYAVEEGAEFFGDTAVVKCSYTVERKKKIYHLSFFCEKNGTYFVCEGRRFRDTVLLYGHWRKAAANGAGLVQLEMTPSDGNIRLHGCFGNDNQKPQQPLVLRFCSPLPKDRSFEIIGHRGAARNVDFLPVSENSLELMKMAARLGATGVEIDVRMTKDGVPVVFHDSFLSVHTVQGKVYGGLLHNYTLKELKKVKLRKGGSIPTLDECLHTILHKTPLQTVWLDIKKECNLEVVHQLQQRYRQRAAAMGRSLFIYIGIPDKMILHCFKQLKNYKDVPSLTELEPEVVLDIGANVWAPQYTNGFQTENVNRVKKAGAKAFVWSLDSELLIDLYMNEGGFDGLVTNTPAVVAHWYYMNGAATAAALPKSKQH